LLEKAKVPGERVERGVARARDDAAEVEAKRFSRSKRGSAGSPGPTIMRCRGIAVRGPDIMTMMVSLGTVAAFGTGTDSDAPC
jgi:hypothetical protein